VRHGPEISSEPGGACCERRGAAETEVLFSQDGYPVYTYTNNRGLTRQVELKTHGQQIEYVPAGGGVQRIVVENIDQRPDTLIISLKGSFEKAGGGY
jgi:hypothetical protein